MKKNVLALIVIMALVFGALAPTGYSEDTIIKFSNIQGKNPKVQSIEIIIQEGARPRFYPDGKSIVFDRKNADGYYDLYVADLEGNIISSLTQNNPQINQKNNGNGVFHPSGKYVVFISEENRHLQKNVKYLGDPGVGLYCNLWAIELASKKAWKLTDIPIKTRIRDKIPAIGIVNPHFSPDGKTLIWTERYAAGGHHNWGLWRIKAASFAVKGDRPVLSNEMVLFTPPKGNYVTFMGFPGVRKLLLSGNLDGQHEYGMDGYIYDISTKQLTNLTNSPATWEEDATILADGNIIYMSNINSKYKFDFANPNWAAQPTERDYYLMKWDGTDNERLTYFNDSTAPEYVGKRVLAVASDASPDGKLLAATLGVDFGYLKRKVVLKIALIRLKIEMTMSGLR